jgi:hypothetical protein
MPLHSIQGLLPEVNSGESSASCSSRRQDCQRGEVRALASNSYLAAGVVAARLSRDQCAREAVLLSFCDPLPDQCLQLLRLSTREWRKLLEWLDISGLALYFLDRLEELGIRHRMPAAVTSRLQGNLIDNAMRTSGMIAESVAIQQEFQDARLAYAVLKGFSLCPISVPRPELRHQFDLDFLVSKESVLEARQILERRGYRLYAISGSSWEFKINEIPGVPLKDFYKDLPGRSVELHVESDQSRRPSMLDRREECEFHGIRMPVLSQVDLFIGQGLHAYKDICSEFSRASHLIEFRRHVLARRFDDAFWNQVYAAGSEHPRVRLGLGVVTQLITHVMGEFAPEALTRWTVGSLPPSVLSWIAIYGRRAVLKKFPGNKLYLLLQKELEAAGVPAKRSLERALLPLSLPPSVVKAAANEAWSRRVRRHRLQLHVILTRLRFHIVEGLRYSWESRRWRRHMSRIAQ